MHVILVLHFAFSFGIVGANLKRERERVLDVYKVMGILQCWLYMNKEMGEPVYLVSQNWLERESSLGFD